MRFQSNPVEAVFSAALEIVDAQERLAYLQEACGEDVALRSRVLALLRAHEQAGNFLSATQISSAGNQDTTGTESVPQAPAPPVERLGDYRLIREVGRGGMGIVYEAEQVSLGRSVALKLLPAQLVAGDLQRRRFEREARAAALLHHTNIVPVFGVGEQDGLCYYVMQFIEGRGLDEVIREARQTGRPNLGGETQPRAGGSAVSFWTSVAQIGRQAADALQYAHDQHILHRDIKPSNLLLDLQGAVWITDFGLAKTGEQQDLTRTGDLLGTLRYLPPEALEGSTDPRSDLYSLGLTLYELLALRPAFSEKDPSKLIQQIAAATPPRLEKLHREIPRDLATIVHKAIERDPAHRYRSAGEMAADLQRFLEDQPIRARRVSLLEQLGRWSRRNKALAASLSAVALLVTVLTISSMLAARYFQNLNEALSSSLRDLEIANQIAEAKAVENAELAKREHAAAIDFDRERRRAQRQAADLALDRGITLCEKGDIAPGLLWMARSLELLGGEDEDLDRVIRTNLGSWSERIGPLEHALAHPASVTSVAFSSDGRFAATGSSDSIVRIWDTVTGNCQGQPLPHNDLVRSVAFSPDGKTVLTGGRDATARLWGVATGQPCGAPLRHGTAVTLAMFTSDGKKIVSVGGKHVQLWDATTSQPIGSPLVHPLEITSAALSLDGQLLLTGCGSDEDRRGEAHLWSLTTLQPAAPPRVWETVVSCVALRPDGRMALAGGRDGTARWWRVEDGTQLGPILQHDGEVKSAAFNADGSVALTGSLDGKARLWNVATGDLLGAPLQHENHVWAVAFSTDGKHVLTGSEDGRARLWDVSRIRPRERLLAVERPENPSPYSRRVCFRPDGELLLTGDQQGIARLWDVTTAQPVGPPLINSHEITALAFSPDSAAALVGCGDGSVRIWDVAACAPVGAVMQHEGAITELRVSSDGRTVLTGSLDRTARLWDAATGRPLAEPMAHPGVIWDVRFGHGGASAFTSCADGVLRAWRVPTGEPAGVIAANSSTVWEMAFARDDQTLFAGAGPSSGSRGEAFLWDTIAARSRVRTLRHRGAVSSVAFSPNERLLLTGSFDRTAQLWDAASGQPVHPPLVHQGKVWDVDFSPDGEILLTAAEDRTVRLWDVATGKPLGPPLVHPAPVHNAEFCSDNVTLATGCMDDNARLWRRPTPLPGETATILLRTRVYTGMELDAVGVPKRLDDESLGVLRTQLTSQQATK